MNRPWQHTRPVSWWVLAVLLLAIAVGVHALANQPTSIVQSDLPAPLLMVLALLLALAWPRLRPRAAASRSG